MTTEEKELKLWQDTKNYYNDDGMLSNSFLKAILKGPSSIKDFFNFAENKKFSSRKRHLILGSAVDSLLTYPTTFDKEFTKADFKKPSKAVAEITEFLFENYSNNIKALAYVPEKAMHDACREFSWYGDDKFKDSRINKLISEGGLYYNHLFNNKDRYILTSEEYQQVNAAANLLETHSNTSPFFSLETTPGVITFKAVRIDWTCAGGISPRGHKCKVLIDRLYINTTDKDIILSNGFVFPKLSLLPIDYKTMGMPIHKFSENYLTFRYDFQGAFYHDACINKAATISQKNNKKFTVCSPVFLVVSYFSTITAWYQMPTKDLVIGRSGGIVKDKGFSTNIYREGRQDIPGYSDAIKLYEKYKDSGQWDNHPDLITNNGKMEDFYGGG